MARRLTGRNRTIFMGGKHPEYLEVARTYLAALPGGIEVLARDAATGATALADVETALGEDVACLVVQNPNFYGTVVDVRPLAAAAHKVGAMCVVVTTDPSGR